MEIGLDACLISQLGVQAIADVLAANQRSRYNQLMGRGPRGERWSYPEWVWLQGLSLAASEQAELIHDRLVDGRRRAQQRSRNR